MSRRATVQPQIAPYDSHGNLQSLTFDPQTRYRKTQYQRFEYALAAWARGAAPLAAHRTDTLQFEYKTDQYFIGWSYTKKYAALSNKERALIFPPPNPLLAINANVRIVWQPQHAISHLHNEWILACLLAAWSAPTMLRWCTLWISDKQYGLKLRPALHALMEENEHPFIQQYHTDYYNLTSRKGRE